jgi:hypothetical protein
MDEAYSSFFFFFFLVENGWIWDPEP